MKKIIIASILLLSVLIPNILSSQNIYETIKYKGKVGTSDVVVNISYMGNVLFGNYYYTKYNSKINFMSKKDYMNEKDTVILIEYIDTGFSKHEEIEKAMEKSTGNFRFSLNDLKNFMTKNTLYGKWFSSDGTTSYNVVLTKT